MNLVERGVLDHLLDAAGPADFDAVNHILLSESEVDGAGGLGQVAASRMDHSQHGLITDAGQDPGADGVAVDQPPREGMDGVRYELEMLRMSQYAAAFERHGYDVWGEILSLPPHRLAKLIELVGMSANHSDRFKEALVAQRRRLKILQVLPSAGGGGDDSCVIL